MEQVTIERIHGIAVVRIDDGHENRFGRGLAESLRLAALSLQDTPASAVLIEGGTDFSAGLADTDDPLFDPFRQLVACRDAFRAQEIVQRYQNALASLSRLPCPVVAAIEGRCHGPALALALSADIRVASLESTFAPTPLSLGLVPGVGELTQLGHRAGLHRIAATVLTGGSWDATEALDLGLVSQLVPPGTAASVGMELIEAMLALPSATRLQALVTLRAMAADPAKAANAESEGGARTWVRGEWQR